jgi:hypothetical protein
MIGSHQQNKYNTSLIIETEIYGSIGHLYNRKVIAAYTVMLIL